MKEIFKPIPDYPKYEVSNLGRVKSLQYGKERILKPNSNGFGYLKLYISKDCKIKTHYIHHLVAMAFLDHIPNGHKIVIDHIDENKQNNHATNLRIVTQRFNTSRRRGTSKYTGVSWDKRAKKWSSQIVINNKKKYLGLFKNEYDAHLEYQKELKLITKN